MMKKRFAFTLGEILIALGVIGVIAALVIPQLVNGQKAGEARAQFDTAYSLLAKTIADMDADNLPVLPANYTSGGLYEAIKDYNKVTFDCGGYGATKNDSICISYGANDQTGTKDNYYTYNKTTSTKINLSRLDDGAFVLNNGMLVAVENPGGTSTVGGKTVPNPILISVDINGKAKNPNRWGWDLFTFALTDEGIQPLGAPASHPTYSANPDEYCNPTGGGNENGITCGYYAATNQDYFKNIYKGH